MPSGAQFEALARAIAHVVHDGQSRRGSGEPYFNHVARVENRVAGLGWQARVVALLHDVIEDTRVTWRTLDELNLPGEVTSAVDYLTRDIAIGETYPQFITRLVTSGPNLALQVKLADLHDNLTDAGGGAKASSTARYTRADTLIRAELLARGQEPLIFGTHQ